MNILIFIVGIVLAALLAGLVYAGGKRKSATPDNAESLGNLSLCCNHVANLAQLRQALDSADLEYIKNRLDPRAVRRIRRERQRVASSYLEALHEDFVHLMRAAQLVATLSPEVKAHQEWRRFRLNLEFRLKYRLLKTRFALGATQFPSLAKLAILVSSLTMDLERAVNELGAASLLARERTLSGR